MVKHHAPVRPDRSWKPRELLRNAEALSATVRKQLRQWKRRFPDQSGSIDDAVALALLIEQLARKGRTATAAQATDIADKVDQLIDLIGTEIDDLLTS